jgi:hypothetical protein
VKLTVADWRAAVPGEMRALHRWVGWKHKVPRHPVKDTNASAGQPATWGAFEEACAYYAWTLDDPDAGAGFQFHGDGLVGIDLDLALDEGGEILPWAAPLLEPFQDLGGAYAEISPSGRGLHLICRADLRTNPGRADFGGVVERIDKKDKKSGVEVYCEKRYLTVTGQVWRGLATIGGDAGPLVRDLLAATGLDERARAREAPADRRGAEPHREPEVRSALARVDPDVGYEEWLRVGMALQEGLGTAGFGLWDDWSSLGRKYAGRGDLLSHWRSLRPGGGVGLGTLFKMARDAGWEGLSAAEEFGDLTGEAPPAAEEPIPYQRTKKGIVRSSTNVALYFSRHPAWRGRLRWNSRRGAELDGDPLEDRGYTELGGAAERALGFDSALAVDHIYRGVELAARKREYDPIREWVLRQKWDGTPRLDDWLVDAGAEDTVATRMIGRRFLVGAAGRALNEAQPGDAETAAEIARGLGTKMDYVLVLEGEQGLKKSWVCRALCPLSDYFFDSHFDFDRGAKDLYQALGAYFLVEMAELEALSRSNHVTAKEVVTSRFDSYRPPYGRAFVRRGRTSVLTGTVNERNWSKDLTGGRRFWPVPCWGQALRPERVAADREQLWAEAAVRYRAGEVYWEDDEMRALLAPLQAERTIHYGWRATLEDFFHQPEVAARGWVTYAYMIECFRFLNAVSNAEFGKVLRSLECEPRIVKRGPDDVLRIWVLPAHRGDEHDALRALVAANPLPGGDFPALPA